MVYFDNFSLGAWCYFSFHAAYGIIWLIKDGASPDPSFDTPVSMGTIIGSYVFAFIPYSYIGYLMMSK